jgi:hypothetical protein
MGGDYNFDMVTAKRRSVDSTTQAVIRIARAFSQLNDIRK